MDLARQQREEFAALAEQAAHTHLPALRFHQPLGQCQPEARALAVFGSAAIELLEFGEELVDVFGRDAGTAVTHLDAKVPLVGSQHTHAHIAGVGAELQRVREEVVEHRLVAAGVEFDVVQRRIEFNRNPDRLLRGDDAQDVGHLFGQQAQVHRLGEEAELARFDLGQVEHVVDELQQVFAAAQDVAEKSFVLGRDGVDAAVDEQLRETDNGVERRAQLVRHVGQERALQPARGLHTLVLQLQRRGAFAVGHVAHGCEPGLLVVPLDAHHAHLTYPFAIGAIDVKLDRRAVVQRKPERLLLQHLAALAEEFDRRLVHVAHAAEGVDEQDAIGRSVEQGFELALLRALAIDDLHHATPEQAAVGLVLAEQIFGAFVARLHAHLVVDLHRHGDDRHMRLHPLDAAHSLDADRVGQVQVEDDGVDHARGHQHRDGIGQCRGAAHHEFLQPRLGQPRAGQVGNAGVVFHQQDVMRRRAVRMARIEVGSKVHVLGI